MIDTGDNDQWERVRTEVTHPPLSLWVLDEAVSLITGADTGTLRGKNSTNIEQLDYQNSSEWCAAFYI